MAIGNPSSTTAVLKYYVPPADGARAYQHINTDPTTGERPRNFTYQDKDVVVENLRGKESSVSLDTTGFQYVRRPAKHGSFRNDEEIQNEYYPESIELIKELTGASKVVIFDHSKHFRSHTTEVIHMAENTVIAVRRRRPEDKEDTPQKRQPVAQVHVDQTNKSSVARVHRHLPPSEAPNLLQKRFQIINLWRPISHVASDWPLALCDYRSVDPKADMVPTALVYPDREGETFGVKYNPSHQWKYVRDMVPDECVLIKW